MKYTIEGFQQIELIKLGLNHSDALILRWFVDFYPRMIKVYKDIDGEKVEFAWVKYQAILDDLPCIEITNKQVLARRFKKFCEAGLLDVYQYKVGGNYMCYRLIWNIYAPLIERPREDRLKFNSRGDLSTEKSIAPDLKVDNLSTVKLKQNILLLSNSDIISNGKEKDDNENIIFLEDMANTQNIIKYFCKYYPDLHGGRVLKITGKEVGCIKTIIKWADNNEKKVLEQIQLFYEIIKNPPDRYRAGWKFIPSQLVAHWNELAENRPVQKSKFINSITTEGSEKFNKMFLDEE